MNRSTRAYRAAAVCDEAAEGCETATLHSIGAAAADLAEMGKRFRRNADAWRRVAAEESAKERARQHRCWCGRTVTDRSLDGINCTEHDAPPSPLSAAPSNPTTPGGVFAVAI